MGNLQAGTYVESSALERDMMNFADAVICYSKVAGVNYEMIIAKYLIFTSGLPLLMKMGKE